LRGPYDDYNRPSYSGNCRPGLSAAWRTRPSTRSPPTPRGASAW
jgi:hypothetical protein